MELLFVLTVRDGTVRMDTSVRWIKEHTLVWRNRPDVTLIGIRNQTLLQKISISFTIKFNGESSQSIGVYFC